MARKIIFGILGLFLGFEIGKFSSLLPLGFISPYLPFYWSSFFYVSWTAAFMFASGMLGLKVANRLNQKAQQGKNELPVVQDKALVPAWRLTLIFSLVGTFYALIPVLVLAWITLELKLSLFTRDILGLIIGCALYLVTLKPASSYIQDNYIIKDKYSIVRWSIAYAVLLELSVSLHSPRKIVLTIISVITYALLYIFVLPRFLSESRSEEIAEAQSRVADRTPTGFWGGMLNVLKGILFSALLFLAALLAVAVLLGVVKGITGYKSKDGAVIAILASECIVLGYLIKRYLFENTRKGSVLKYLWKLSWRDNTE